MAVPSKVFANISDGQVDPESPGDTVLVTGLRDNTIHNYEWIGKDYTPAQNHDHDGVNSAIITGFSEASMDWANSDGMTQSVMDMNEFTTSGAPTSYQTITEAPIYIPANANTIEFRFKMRTGAGTGSGKFVTGGVSSTEATTTSTTYVPKTVTADISGLSGWQDSLVQAKQTVSADVFIKAMSYRFL